MYKYICTCIMMMFRETKYIYVKSNFFEYFA